eukprot:scaffold65329_cov77-Cyclotella_meneghiniana.AAC.6
MEDYTIGDRVIFTGLQKAPHLNGKHGTIVSNLDPELLRYAVDPDICTLSSRINVKPTNLTTEPPPSHPLGDDRSKAENGILEEKYGRVRMCWKLSGSSPGDSSREIRGYKTLLTLIGSEAKE